MHEEKHVRIDELRQEHIDFPDYFAKLYVDKGFRRVDADTEVAEDLVTRDLGFIMVKNKAEPIRVYELICTAEELTPEIQKRLEDFRKGLDAYQQRRWREALKTFESIDDKPSRAYAESCRRCLAIPPPADWKKYFIPVK